MGLFGDLINVIGQIGQMVSSKKQIELARNVFEEGQHWRNIGFQGLTGSIKRRQAAYDGIWKMVYGGVSGTDMDKIINYSDMIGDRYYYDDEGKLKRKDSIGPGPEADDYFERHPEEKPVSTEKDITKEGGGRGPVSRRWGYSNPGAQGHKDPFKTGDKPPGDKPRSRDTSTTGGGGATKSGVSISRKPLRRR